MVWKDRKYVIIRDRRRSYPYGSFLNVASKRYRFAALVTPVYILLSIMFNNLLEAFMFCKYLVLKTLDYKFQYRLTNV